MSFAARLFRHNPFIAVLNCSCLGRGNAARSVDARCIYARNDRKKSPAHIGGGAGSSTGGNSVPSIDEWCCGYVKGIALDPVGWQPLIDARPDWFAVLPLYGTTCGWERLKAL